MRADGSGSTHLGSLPSVPSGLFLSATYWTIYAINGGMVGAFGPCLEALQRSTGLGEAELGAMVMQNRVAKVCGVLLWTAYARSMRESRWLPRPHTLVALSAVCMALSSAAIANMSDSVVAVRSALIVAGVSYGLCDSAVVLLTLWRFRDDEREQRTAVAVLNATFTVGALLTPMLVADSLRKGGSGRTAYDALSVGALLGSIALPTLAAPAEPTGGAGDEEKEDEEKQPLSPAASETPERSAGEETPLSPRGKAPSLEAQQSGGGRNALLFGCLAVVLCCVTGSEHTVATWLAALGVEVRRDSI